MGCGPPPRAISTHSALFGERLKVFSSMETIKFCHRTRERALAVLFTNTEKCTLCFLELPVPTFHINEFVKENKFTSCKGRV